MVRRAARWCEERREHLHRRRLAGAVRSEEAEDLARVDVEGDVVDGVSRAVVALGELVDVDHRATALGLCAHGRPSRRGMRHVFLSACGPSLQGGYGARTRTRDEQFPRAAAWYQSFSMSALRERVEALLSGTAEGRRAASRWPADDQRARAQVPRGSRRDGPRRVDARARQARRDVGVALRGSVARVVRARLVSPRRRRRESRGARSCGSTLSATDVGGRAFAGSRRPVATGRRRPCASRACPTDRAGSWTGRP